MYVRGSQDFMTSVPFFRLPSFRSIPELKFYPKADILFYASIIKIPSG